MVKFWSQGEGWCLKGGLVYCVKFAVSAFHSPGDVSQFSVSSCIVGFRQRYNHDFAGLEMTSLTLKHMVSQIRKIQYSHHVSVVLHCTIN